ncbi:hypothetical protein BET03_04540 [Thermohalobacter berrensis]|uniref:Spore coat protein n=1 Tax=Thermohalobacter berrensis TaxID=99594 RepID=A0A419SZM8_9FIRM|nr:hypothetical protein BET03_04540 [Thermohalobacter berrensis]
MTLKNTLNLSNLNQQELQNLRHIIMNHQMMESKLRTYAQNCRDQQLKQMFEQGARSAGTTAQNLINSL